MDGGESHTFPEDERSLLLVLGVVLLGPGLLTYLLDEGNRILIDRSLSETDNDEDGRGKQQLTQNEYHPSVSPCYMLCHDLISAFVPHTDQFNLHTQPADLSHHLSGRNANKSLCPDGTEGCSPNAGPPQGRLRPESFDCGVLAVSPKYRLDRASSRLKMATVGPLGGLESKLTPLGMLPETARPLASPGPPVLLLCFSPSLCGRHVTFGAVSTGSPCVCRSLCVSAAGACL